MKQCLLLVLYALHHHQPLIHQSVAALREPWLCLITPLASHLP